MRFKRRGGNGSSKIQTIYLMVNLPFVWAWKIGITSRGARARQLENSKSVPGVCLTIIAVRIWKAYAVEQWLLKKTLWARCTVFGRGGTEYRLLPAGIMAFAFLFLLKALSNPIDILVGFLLIWLLMGSPQLL